MGFSPPSSSSILRALRSWLWGKSLLTPDTCCGSEKHEKGEVVHLDVHAKPSCVAEIGYATFLSPIYLGHLFSFCDLVVPNLLLYYVCVVSCSIKNPMHYIVLFDKGSYVKLDIDNYQKPGVFDPGT